MLQVRVRRYVWSYPEPDTSSLAKTLELIVLHFDVMQMGAQAESDHTPSRTRHKYIPVGSDASSLTHTVLEEAWSLYPACAIFKSLQS